MRGYWKGAALTVLVIGAGLFGACVGDSAENRGGKTPPPVEIVKPTADATFDRTFSWRPVASATGYRVVVFNPAGERSFEVRDVRGTSVAIAESVVLAPGQYSWQVIAFRGADQLTESAKTSFAMK